MYFIYIYTHTHTHTHTKRKIFIVAIILSYLQFLMSFSSACLTRLGLLKFVLFKRTRFWFYWCMRFISVFSNPLVSVHITISSFYLIWFLYWFSNFLNLTYHFSINTFKAIYFPLSIALASSYNIKHLYLPMLNLG